MNIIEAFDQTTSKFGDKVALNFQGQETTFRELAFLSRQFAASMIKLGVQTGDRVAIYAPNTIEVVVSWLGAARAGATIILIHPLLKSQEIEYILRDSETLVLITDIQHLEIVNAVREKLHAINHMISLSPEHSIDTQAYTDLMTIQHTQEPSWPEQGTKDPLLLVYTSGTTGRRKGAILSHGNVLESIRVIKQRAELSDKDRSICNFPASSVGGIVTSILVPLLSGSTTYLMERFVAEEAASLVTRHKITWFFGVPTMYFYLLDLPEDARYDFSSLRFCWISGAPVPEDLFIAFRDRFNLDLLEGYGSTEALSISLTPLGQARLGSAGKPNDGVEVEIRDEQDNPLPVGQSGEIVVRGPQVMQGYWGLPEATAEAMRGGWFHTGDIGKLDEDGYIYILDRKSDMIISRGYNIYPKEVESVLLENPKVKQAAVIGVPHPTFGEIVKSFVVLHPGMNATMEEILNSCLVNLAAYKVPKLIEFRDNLPLGDTGKVLKSKLREESSASINALE